MVEYKDIPEINIKLKEVSCHGPRRLKGWRYMQKKWTFFVD